MSLFPRPATAVVVALLASGAAVPVAHAASYEQISRATGIAGATQLGTTSLPLFASDSGLIGASTTVPNPSQSYAQPITALRNTLTNTTTYPHPDAGTLQSTDRTGTIGLYQRFDLTTGEYVWSVGSVDGSGSVKEVARGVPYPPLVVELSGDGRSVVVTSGSTTSRVTIATGAATVISTAGLQPAPVYAQSDDASVVAGLVYGDDGQPSGVIYAGTKRIAVPAWPWIAPDGRTAAWIAGPSTGGGATTQLSILTIATGKITSVAVPAPVDDSYLITWISPDGSRIAVADSGTSGDIFTKPAEVFDRTTGRWSTFGGPFAGWIKSAHNHSAISRNGQFASVAYDGQVALVNLSGGPLLGNLLGLEPVSASSYIAAPFGLFQGCGDSATASGQFEQPAAWIAAPKKAVVTVSADGHVVATQTLVKTESAPYANDGDAFNVTFPATATNGSVKVSVVDGAGRTVTETFSQKVAC